MGLRPFLSIICNNNLRKSNIIRMFVPTITNNTPRSWNTKLLIMTYQDEEFSNCCGAARWGETDICSDCQEHADFEEEE